MCGRAGWDRCPALPHSQSVVDDDARGAVVHSAMFAPAGDAALLLQHVHQDLRNPKTQHPTPDQQMLRPSGFGH